MIPGAMSEPRPVPPWPGTDAESARAPQSSESATGSTADPSRDVHLPEGAGDGAIPPHTAEPGDGTQIEVTAGQDVVAAPAARAASGPAAPSDVPAAARVYWLASAEAAESAAASVPVDASPDRDAAEVDGAVPSAGPAVTDDREAGGGPAPAPTAAGEDSQGQETSGVAAGVPMAAPTLVRPERHGVAARTVADRAARAIARLMVLLALMAAAGYGLAILVSRVAVDQTAVTIPASQAPPSSVGTGGSGDTGGAGPARSGTTGPPASARPDSPAATRAAAASSAQVHIVARGETLAAIAALYGVTIQQLTAANGIVNPDLIYVGQRLVIPVP